MRQQIALRDQTCAFTTHVGQATNVLPVSESRAMCQRERLAWLCNVHERNYLCLDRCHYDVAVVNDVKMTSILDVPRYHARDFHEEQFQTDRCDTNAQLDAASALHMWLPAALQHCSPRLESAQCLALLKPILLVREICSSDSMTLTSASDSSSSSVPSSEIKERGTSNQNNEDIETSETKE